MVTLNLGYHEPPFEWESSVPPYKRGKVLGQNLLHQSNPLQSSQLTFERIQIIEEWLNKNNKENVFMGKEEYFEDDKVSDTEKKFSKEFIQDFFVEVFDERTYENILIELFLLPKIL